MSQNNVKTTNETQHNEGMKQHGAGMSQTGAGRTQHMSQTGMSQTQQTGVSQTQQTQQAKQTQAKKQRWSFSKLTPAEYAKDLYAGGTAGCLAKTVIAPLERVKFLFQINSPHYPYRGIMQTLQKIYIQENIPGYFKGHVSSLTRVFPYAAIQFSVFEHCSTQFKRPDGKVPWYGKLFSGSMAGLVAVIFTYPLDLIRLRFAVQYKNSVYDGFFNGIRTMAKNEGPYFFVKGMKPTIIGIIPYAGLNFFIFHSLKQYYCSWQGVNTIPVMSKLAFGAIAGMIGQTATYPLDTVRRRAQMQGANLVSEKYPFKYQGMIHGLRHIIKTEGVVALYRGVTINWIKVAPVTSISFSTFEWLRPIMRNQKSFF